MSFFYGNIWQPEKDPLEIEEELVIKEEQIDPLIKQEINDIEFSDNNYDTQLLEQSILPGIKKIVNVDDLLKANNDPEIKLDFTSKKVNIPHIKSESIDTNENIKDSVGTRKSLRNSNRKVITSANNFFIKVKNVHESSTNNGAIVIDKPTKKLVNAKKTLKNSKFTVNKSKSKFNLESEKKNIPYVIKKSNVSNTSVKQPANAKKKVKNRNQIDNTTTNKFNSKAQKTYVPSTNKNCIDNDIRVRKTLVRKSLRSSNSINSILATRLRLLSEHSYVATEKKTSSFPKTIGKKPIDLKKSRKINNETITTPEPINEVQVSTVDKLSFSTNKGTAEKDKLKCDCMKYLQLHCTKCDKDSVYQQDLTQCLKCKTLLKLRCVKCLKRYSYLSSVHQYIVKFSKRLNLLTPSKKEIKVTCLKKKCYECSECHINFEDREALKQHLRTVHEQKSEVNDYDEYQFIEFYCQFCEQSFKRMTQGSKRKRKCQICEQAMLYQCIACKSRYTSLIQARDHLEKCKNYLKIRNVYCDYCNFETEKRSILESHIISYHIPQTCTICKTEFQNSNDLAQHKIEECSTGLRKTYSQKNKPLKTEENISEEEIEAINVADDYYDDKYEILENDPSEILKQITSSKSPEAMDWQNLIDFYCMFCGDTVRKKFTQVKPRCLKCYKKYDYRCIYCDKLYRQCVNIYRHVTTECPNRQTYKCTFCRFGHARKYVLYQHIKAAHTVFKCKNCKSIFTGSSAMKTHRSSCLKIKILEDDSEVKKLIALYYCNCFKSKSAAEYRGMATCRKCLCISSYRCTKCQSTFPTYEAVYEHVQEKCLAKYACTECNFRTVVLSHLKIHLSKMHKLYKCPECFKMFNNILDYGRHRREELKNKQEPIMFSEPMLLETLDD